MIEYIYRGFKISYDVQPSRSVGSAFEAKGFVTQLLKKPRLYPLVPMQALQERYVLVEDEIKRKLENQIDEVLHVYFEKVSTIPLGSIM